MQHHCEQLRTVLKLVQLLLALIAHIDTILAVKHCALAM
jgi:hypothetical protein